MMDCTSLPLFLSFFQCGTCKRFVNVSFSDVTYAFAVCILASCAMCGHSMSPAFLQASHMSETLMALNMGSPLSCFISII